MVLVAGRREGAGHREQHHLFALEQIVGLHRLDTIGRLLLQHDAGNLVANLNGHGLSLVF
jgi:hypothetical protein